MVPLLQFGLINAVLATLLAGVVTLIAWRDRRPALVHLLWILVLAKLVTPPLVKVGVDLPLPTRSTSALQSAVPWLPAAACGIWGCGSAIWLTRQAWLAWRFRRLLAHAAPAPAAFQHQAAQVARQLGLARCPEVLLVPEAISPLLYGVGRGIRLLFPLGLLERIGVESRGTLLAHELAHFGRGDHWVRALELVVAGIYWWHPLVWWGRRRIEAAEEECCDAWVIAHCAASPRIYAEALLETIDFLSESCVPRPPVATGLGQVPQLRQRLTQIMRGATPRALSGSGRVAVLLLAAAFLPVYPVFSRSESRDVAAPMAQAGRLLVRRSPTSRLGIRKQFRIQSTSGTVVISRPSA